MLVKDLFQQIRYAINDQDKIEFSDAELLNYVNQAQDYISNIAINNGFKGLLKETDLTLTNSQATLPSDFVREYSVTNGMFILKSVPPDAEVDEFSYKIIGRDLYSKNENLKLYYFYMYPAYVSVNDELAIPNIFLNLLREIATYLALNRVNINTNFEVQLAQFFESRLLQVINNYGNSNIERPMPFVV
ncbi:hypothetical protein [Persephonella sp.]|uniref:phage adaptor protein n=1 Tax=Persephonella sp. TaxID=2060922 RepID=UPI002620614B|nr:hypothetical protein [Persephonella sp.]